MSKKAKGMILFLIVAIIAIVVFLCCAYAKGLNIAKNNENIYAMNETITNNVENNIISNEATNVENTVDEKVVEKNEQEKNKEPENTEEVKEPVVDNESELESNDDETKAISIVKNDWGDTEGFAFKVEQINGDGSYVVSVRNEDAIALAWYTVYPKNGNFTK